MVIRRLRGYKVSTRTILRKRNQAGYDGDTNINLHDTSSKLQESYGIYNNVVKGSLERRVTFISDLAVAQDKAGNVNVTNTIKSLEEQETLRATWACIHRMGITTHTCKDLSMVEVLNFDGGGTSWLLRKILRKPP